MTKLCYVYPTQICTVVNKLKHRTYNIQQLAIKITKIFFFTKPLQDTGINQPPPPPPKKKKKKKKPTTHPTPLQHLPLLFFFLFSLL